MVKEASFERGTGRWWNERYSKEERRQPTNQPKVAESFFIDRIVALRKTGKKKRGKKKKGTPDPYHHVQSHNNRL